MRNSMSIPKQNRIVLQVLGTNTGVPKPAGPRDKTSSYHIPPHLPLHDATNNQPQPQDVPSQETSVQGVIPTQKS